MIRIAVCDDERCFTEQIDHIIANHARDITPPPKTVLYTSSGQLLYDVEEGAHFDLLLLDIEMPEKDGMCLAASLRRLLPMALIIFITSHTQYAVKAYELSVFRYIPKSEMETCLPLALKDAYEAARAMPDGQGWILFKMRKAREMLFIDLSNPPPEPPRVKNGAIISRKQDGRLHGLGLNRASATAREYGGQLTYGYDGSVFTASISFLGGVKGKAK
ncbi:hypothetical protein ADH76_19355 [Enterocloster clostridioformis]|uniref:response regulator n=1 Tax=Enterocloster clostridioformis TaxID=1531 RepID=UPI0009C24361|nr:response regulator [Enterocloster clostridioformis]ARE65094.1 hypothetical protein A4V08_36615 [Lachnoclostridium sp. YL32]NDO30712.1 response regulator [Enterocloster clostridioformis]OXE66160.1 hypothetical protein ADH76_19355 [Enterocloster clostridioformis]QQR03449.1 response regulator [Enterocloster clostridioformis]